MSRSPKHKKSRVGIRNAVSPNPSWKINISQEFPVLVIKKLKNKHLARSLRTSHQKKFINQLKISRQMCLLLRLPGLPANLSYKPATSEKQTSKMGGEWDGRTFVSNRQPAILVHTWWHATALSNSDCWMVSFCANESQKIKIVHLHPLPSIAKLRIPERGKDGAGPKGSTSGIFPTWLFISESITRDMVQWAHNKKFKIATAGKASSIEKRSNEMQKIGPTQDVANAKKQLIEVPSRCRHTSSTAKKNLPGAPLRSRV